MVHREWFEHTMVSRQFTPIAKHGVCATMCGKVNHILPPKNIITCFSKHFNPDAISTIFWGLKIAFFFDADQNGSTKRRNFFRP